MAGADLEIVDGRYVMRTALMVAAPVEPVRRLLADQARLVEWVPLAAAGPGPVADGEVRLTIGVHGGADHLGRTDVEADGTVVRRWTLPVPPIPGGRSEPTWWREVRYDARTVQGGSHLMVEVVTTVVGAPARNLRGARAEARGLEDAMARLVRLVGGRPQARRSGRAAGPL